MRNRWLAAAGVAAILVLAGCGSSSSSAAGGGSGSGGSGSGGSGSGPGIKTAKDSIGTVLTDSSGKTLYWFAPDTQTKSNCNSSCAQFWPPLKGPVTAASGVSLPGHFGTITRSDGTKQATYDGHPLYTYTGDSAAGQTKGNGLNLSGGLWHAVTPSGAMLASSGGAGSPKPSSTKSSGGGGYGY